jgi:hypothetical protein
MIAHDPHHIAEHFVAPDIRARFETTIRHQHPHSPCRQSSMESRAKL